MNLKDVGAQTGVDGAYGPMPMTLRIMSVRWISQENGR